MAPDALHQRHHVHVVRRRLQRRILGRPRLRVLEKVGVDEGFYRQREGEQAEMMETAGLEAAVDVAQRGGRIAHVERDGGLQVDRRQCEQGAQLERQFAGVLAVVGATLEVVPADGQLLQRLQTPERPPMLIRQCGRALERADRQVQVEAALDPAGDQERLAADLREVEGAGLGKRQLGVGPGGGDVTALGCDGGGHHVGPGAGRAISAGGQGGGNLGLGLGQ